MERDNTQAERLDIGTIALVCRTVGYSKTLGLLSGEYKALTQAADILENIDPQTKTLNQKAPGDAAMREALVIARDYVEADADEYPSAFRDLAKIDALIAAAPEAHEPTVGEQLNDIFQVKYEAQVKPAAPVTDEWTDVAKRNCENRCGEFGVPPCYKLPDLTSDAPKDIKPCADCCTPPGDVAMQERPVSAIADKAADRIGWFILENLPPKTTIVWNKTKVAAIIQRAIDASQPTVAAPVLPAGYERVMALAHEAVKRGTDAMNSVSREAYMFASMLVQLEAANTQPAQRK